LGFFFVEGAGERGAKRPRRGARPPLYPLSPSATARIPPNRSPLISLSLLNLHNNNPKNKTNSGTFLATALNLIVAAATKADPWINDNSLYGHYDYYYFLNAAILFVAFCIYVPVSRAYIERPIVGARSEDEEEEAEAAEALKAAAVAANKRRFEDKVGAHLNPEDNAVISLDKK
jgi:hypothetical protein